MQMLRRSEQLLLQRASSYVGCPITPYVVRIVLLRNSQLLSTTRFPWYNERDLGRISTPCGLRYKSVIHLGIGLYAIYSSLGLRLRYCKSRIDLHLDVHIQAAGWIGRQVQVDKQHRRLRLGGNTEFRVQPYPAGGPHWQDNHNRDSYRTIDWNENDKGQVNCEQSLPSSYRTLLKQGQAKFSGDLRRAATARSPLLVSYFIMRL